jgi:hypothetical protein
MRFLALVILAGCYQHAPPPPPPAPPVVVTPPVAPVPSASCKLVAMLHDGIRQVGNDTVITGKGHLAVFDVDVTTGATSNRVDIATDRERLPIYGAAIRRDEIVLNVHTDGDDAIAARARIDLKTQRLEVGQEVPLELSRSLGALASDGTHVYMPCGRDRVCRGEDWEVRGQQLALSSTAIFEAMTARRGELYAFDDGTLRVFDVATGAVTRELAIAKTARGGIALYGDDIVTLEARTLSRFDRRTGEPRGTAQIAGLDAAVEMRVTCR